MSAEATTYSSQRLEEIEPSWWKYFGGLVVLVLVLAILFSLFQSYFLVHWVSQKPEPTHYGVSGDFFGFTNSMFSALAFAALIVTLAMQRYELRKQREELAMTREQLELQRHEFELNRGVMEGQRDELTFQREAMQRQVFENVLFHLIREFTNAKSKIGVAPIIGQSYIETTLSDAMSHLARFRQYAQENNQTPEESARQWLKNLANRTSLFESYTSLFLSILTYLDSQTTQFSQSYSHIAMSFLSSRERQYLSTLGIGDPVTRKLLSKFGITLEPLFNEINELIETNEPNPPKTT